LFLFIISQNAQAVIIHHGNSVLKALVDLFPEIDWEAQQYGSTYFLFYYFFPFTVASITFQNVYFHVEVLLLLFKYVLFIRDPKPMG
jgi:hypothetical protein